MLEVLKAFGGVIRQVRVLGMAPNAFHRIEIRGVGWQPLDNDPSLSLEPVSDQFRSMWRTTVPDERESLRQVSPKVLDEAKNLSPTDVVGILGPVEPIPPAFQREGESADGREAIASVPLTQDRCLTSRCPSPSHQRLKHEAALIKEDHTSAGPPGVFLYAAIFPSATPRWHPRLSPGRAAPVSDNSIPHHAAPSRRGRDGTELQRRGR